MINSVTREPVGHALVYSQDNRLGTLTDAQGHFEFAFPKPAQVQARTSSVVSDQISVQPYPFAPAALMARKPGFLEDTQSANTRIGPGDELTIALVPEALIIGRVILPSAEPAEQVQLQLYQRKVQQGRSHWVLRNSVSARSNGEFRFSELAAGTYKLLTNEYVDRDPLNATNTGEFYGYPPVYYPDASNFAAASLIHLTPGETIQADLNLKRQLYHNVRISLAGLQSEAGVNVTVSREGQPGPGFSLGYSPDLNAISGSLPDGAYVVHAFTFPPQGASGVVNLVVKGMAAQSSIVLLPNRSIPVNVDSEFTGTEDSGKPEVRVNGGPLQVLRQNVTVTLEPANDFAPGQAVMANAPKPKETSMMLENVQPGAYWVRFDNTRGYVASASAGGIDLLRKPLMVGFGTATPALDITLRDDTAQLSGTIEGIGPNAASGNSDPAANQGSVVSSLRANYANRRHVYCIPLPDSAGQFKEAWVSPDGSFTLPPLAPGSYRVLAFDSAQDELEYYNPEAMRAYDSKGQVVHVVAGQKERLKLPLITDEK